MSQFVISLNAAQAAVFLEVVGQLLSKSAKAVDPVKTEVKPEVKPEPVVKKRVRRARSKPVAKVTKAPVHTQPEPEPFFHFEEPEIKLPKEPKAPKAPKDKSIKGRLIIRANPNLVKAHRKRKIPQTTERVLHEVENNASEHILHHE